MRACEVTVVVEGKEIISMNEQAYSGDPDALLYEKEILECAEMLIAFCGGRKSKELEVAEKHPSANKEIDSIYSNLILYVKGCKDIDRPLDHDSVLREVSKLKPIS